MTEPSAVTEHTHDAAVVSGGRALLPYQFRDAAKLRALFGTWLVQVQEAEDAVWALLTETSIDDAEGAQLDQLGALLLFDRGELEDDTYRALIRAIVRARKSNGTAEDVIACVRLALASDAFTYAEGAASILVEPSAPLGFDGTALLRVLSTAKAGGVALQLVVPPDDGDNLFTTSSDPLRCEPSITQGLGITPGSGDVGGRLTGVLAA